MSSLSLYGGRKICFIDEADYLSKNAQASLRVLIEKSSDNCRFIFAGNDIKKFDPAITSRLIPVCFDMYASQVQTELEKYTERTIEKLKGIFSEVYEGKVRQIINLYFPDYRTIANKLEFEMV